MTEEDIEGLRPDVALWGYRRMLAALAKAHDPTVAQIFAAARTSIKKSATPTTLVRGIDRLEWYSGSREEFGDIYLGLLENNAARKSPEPASTLPLAR